MRVRQYLPGNLSDTRDSRTPIWKCDVMLHVAIILRYASWKWEDETEETIIHHHTTPHSTPKAWILDEGEDEYVDDEEMHSIHYTRGVMSWLRPDGIAISEKGLYNHEWLADEAGLVHGGHIWNLE